MPAKKVPRGGFDMKDIEKHRMNMAKICLDIRGHYGDGNGKSAPRNLNWRFPSLREPRKSFFWKSKQHGIAVWNYHEKRWDTYSIEGDVTERIRMYYTGSRWRWIGASGSIFS